MDNYSIADQFSMLSKLMDIHGENSFKSKTYSSAAFNIEKLPVQLTDLERSKIFALKGIGESTGKKIIEILAKGHLQALEDYVSKTPPGILEMMSIKGLGPKKINTIWKEMEIESMGELLYACNENRLARFKGFGEKTQKNVMDAINFFMKSKGSHLFASIEEFALEIHKILKKKFSDHRLEMTGAYRRNAEIIDKLEWVTTAPIDEIRDFFASNNHTEEDIEGFSASFRGPENVLLQFYFTKAETFTQKLFETSAATEFMEGWNELYPDLNLNLKEEDEVFKLAGINKIPPFLREKKSILEKAKTESFTAVIQAQDIRGIIHSHSTWSDGTHSIEAMANACIKKGYEYLVISDHSRSAFYANGLQEERIIRQHEEIDELNKKLKPFRIFKSIESDILNDGNLDYSDQILASFDLVIASVHSNLKMTIDKSMPRLLKAISNPYTTILGHMTSRLLLSRPGFPVDYFALIDACKEHDVVIELNANPRRLDLDWRYIDYALEKGVMISIDPDAHDISEFDLCRYGVLMAQKAGVSSEQNLSSFGLKELEAFLKKRRPAF